MSNQNQANDDQANNPSTAKLMVVGLIALGSALALIYALSS